MTESKKKFELASKFEPAGDQPNAIRGLCEGLDDGLMHQTLLGVTGSGKTFTMAQIIAKTNRPTVVMAPNKTLAAQLYGEMKAFFPNNAVEYFVSYYDFYQPEAYVPASDTFIEKDASINDHIEQMRLSATKALLERNDTIIVATVSAIYGLGDPASYHKMRLHLSRGEMIDQRKLLRGLATMQYTRNDLDLVRGTYRVRGDVIDVFPAESESEAVRIELFGDEIETIAYFDPLTGELRDKIPRITIYPKNHYVTPREQILQAVDLIKAELKVRLKELEDNRKLVEAQRLEQRTKYDIEMLLEIGHCNGIENYSRHLAGRQEGDTPATLINYLPDNALMILDESHVMVPQLGAMYRGDRARKVTLVEYGFRLPSAMDNRPLQFEEFEKIAPQTIYVSATPGDYEMSHADNMVEQVVRPTGLVDPEIEIRPATTQVDDALSVINEVVPKGGRVLITTLTKRMSENLTDYLSEHDIKVRYLHSDIDTVERVEIIRDLRLGKFDVLVGINLLREGLDMPEVTRVLIMDADKEGFLRAQRSLIQTIGRAARNSEGRAILYADKVTNSMQVAIDETGRRREKQVAYNEANGITPKTILKPVTDIMEGAHRRSNKSKGRKGKSGKAKSNDHPVMIDIETAMEKAASLSTKEVNDLMKVWEQQMLAFAHNLQFEEAARVRDAVEQFKTTVAKQKSE